MKGQTFTQFEAAPLEKITIPSDFMATLSPPHLVKEVCLGPDYSAKQSLTQKEGPGEQFTFTFDFTERKKRESLVTVDYPPYPSATPL